MNEPAVKVFSWKIVFFLLTFILSLWVHHQSAAHAQTAPPSDAPPQAEAKLQPDTKFQLGRLNLGFVVGYYQPNLGELNSVLNDRGHAILEDPNFLLPGNPDFTVEQRNIEVGNMGGAPWLGLEAQWDFSKVFAARITGGVWKGEQIADDSIATFLRSNLPEIQAPRSARYNLVLNQFFLEWRYYFLNDPKGTRLSLDLGVLGVSLGYLTMDSLVKVINDQAPNGGFASVSSTEADGIGYTSRYGFTGEYVVGKRLALGLSAYYIIGQINELQVSRFFSAGFPEIPAPEPLSIRTGVPLPTTPPSPRVEETVRTAETRTDFGRVDRIGPATNLILDLNGFEVSGYLRFYF
jgi:hypothetical protein